jgi:hypothetical protein
VAAIRRDIPRPRIYPFDCLPAEKAQREFLHELATMKSLCLQLLESGRQVA